MKRALLVPAAVLVLLMFAPPADTWKWQTHGATYGTRGISKVAYDAFDYDDGAANTYMGPLDWELIMQGSKMPDTWRIEPYYADSGHTMTYCENQGENWLGRARDNWTANAYDNVAYALGIASHYWADMFQYAHHDNAREYYENAYGEYGYDMWDAIHDHMEGQVKVYRPNPPYFIVQTGGTPYTSLSTFLPAARGFMRDWINATMPPGNPMSPNGWFAQWVHSRKCQNSGDQDSMGPPSGTKDAVDLATTLVYSGWVYALGAQNSIPTSRVRTTFAELWTIYGT